MIRNTSRESLGEVIPLDHPLMVYIEPTNLCNLRCKFCPTGCELSECGPRGIMQWETLVRVIDGIQELGAPKAIGWFLLGEPLLNPRLTEMIRYAKDRLPASIDHRLFTNGTLLNSSWIDRLAACGLNLIRISVEGLSSEAYKDVAGRDVDYGKLLRDISELHDRCRNCHIEAKLVDANLTDVDRKKFHDDFSGIVDEMTIEGIFGTRTDIHDFRMGLPPLTFFRDHAVTPKVCCPYPFFQSAIRWDGRVTTCCADWSNATIMGNVNTESLSDIWRGKRLRDFHLMHLDGRRRENVACATCGVIECISDNIDGHREAITARLKGI